MTPIRRFRISTLVRDKMPERIENLGGRIAIYNLQRKDYGQHLKLKLKEETEEILEAPTLKDLEEENADVLEVLHALAESEGLQWEDIEKKRIQKQNERGGFKNGFFAEYVEVEAEDNNHPVIEYCLSNPKDYPEIVL